MDSSVVLQRMALDALKNVKDGFIIGLGSGRTVAVFVRALARHGIENNLDIKVIPTSLQIKLEAERLGVNIMDDAFIPLIDLVFDGADQIDAKFNMIKGGGGALLREKVLIHASKQTVILADESKYVNVLRKAVPIEVHPYARTYVYESLKKRGIIANIRSNDKGYPFVTENGNIILDANFGEITDVVGIEHYVKNIAGVMEVGLFTKLATLYYNAKNNGRVEVLSP